MVAFDVFWRRFTTELARLPGPRPGVHVDEVRKWSQHSGDLGSEFCLIYRGGNVIECSTQTTNNVRSVSTSEFKKVYGVWNDYRTRRIGRAHIVHDLGVENASWIIPLLHKYVHLIT